MAYVVAIIGVALWFYYNHLQNQKKEFYCSARDLLQAYLRYLSFLNNGQSTLGSSYGYLEIIPKDQMIDSFFLENLKGIYIDLEEIREEKDTYQPLIDTATQRFNKVAKQTELKFTTLEKDLFKVLFSGVENRKVNLNYWLSHTYHKFDTVIKQLNVSEEKRSDIYKEIHKAWEDVEIRKKQEATKRHKERIENDFKCYKNIKRILAESEQRENDK